MSIHYHDPRASAGRRADPYVRRLANASTPTLGLLANGFPDAAAFLGAVETALRELLPQATFTRYAKPAASAPAAPELIQRIVAECDAVVTAYGH